MEKMTLTFDAVDEAEPGTRRQHFRWVSVGRVGQNANSLPDGPFDLITALYFQSHVDLPRARVLREAAGRVAPGGHLLIVSHAAPPPWASAEMLAKADPFPTVEEELEVITDVPEDWTILRAEKVSRQGKGPDGTSAELWDNLIWLERCAA